MYAFLKIPCVFTTTLCVPVSHDLDLYMPITLVLGTPPTVLVDGIEVHVLNQHLVPMTRSSSELLPVVETGSNKHPVRSQKYAY